MPVRAFPFGGFAGFAGIIDILSRDTTEHRWDDDVRGYAPRSQCWLAVYKRRGEEKSN